VGSEAGGGPRQRQAVARPRLLCWQACGSWKLAFSLTPSGGGGLDAWWEVGTASPGAPHAAGDSGESGADNFRLRSESEFSGYGEEFLLSMRIWIIRI
jgi:hypothetical protein